MVLPESFRMFFANGYNLDALTLPLKEAQKSK